MSFANPSALMATENASIFTPNHRFRLKKTATFTTLLTHKNRHQSFQEFEFSSFLFQFLAVFYSVRASRLIFDIFYFCSNAP